MRANLRRKLGERLLDEAGNVLEICCRQTLDEVITDLRIRSIIDKDAREPADLLYGLHSSKIFYLLTDEPAIHIRNAITRYINNEFGQCKNCKALIPESWLLRSPLVEYCPQCMVRVRPSHVESGIRDEQFERTFTE
jgi:RNA polymerase-binding transcription factor DksA